MINHIKVESMIKITKFLIFAIGFIYFINSKIKAKRKLNPNDLDKFMKYIDEFQAEYAKIMLYRFKDEISNTSANILLSNLIDGLPNKPIDVDAIIIKRKYANKFSESNHEEIEGKVNKLIGPMFKQMIPYAYKNKFSHYQVKKFFYETANTRFDELCATREMYSVEELNTYHEFMNSSFEVFQLEFLKIMLHLYKDNISKANAKILLGELFDGLPNTLLNVTLLIKERGYSNKFYADFYTEDINKDLNKKITTFILPIFESIVRGKYLNEYSNSEAREILCDIPDHSIDDFSHS